MKITREDFDALRGALETLPDKRHAYREAGLSPKRYRWDAFFAIPRDERTRLYAYLNDSHIDTALRAIMS